VKPIIAARSHSVERTDALRRAALPHGATQERLLLHELIEIPLDRVEKQLQSFLPERRLLGAASTGRSGSAAIPLPRYNKACV
jgi:hypothetical protein